MSKRALLLPFRLAASSKPQPRQWICRRCLAMQAETPSSSNNLPPMPAITNPSSSDADFNSPTSLPEQIDATEPEHEPPPLSKTDKFLSQPLWHRVPVQYLQHSTSDALSQQEKMQRLKAVPHKDIVGVVVSAGKMDKTVKVRVPGQKWNQKLSKYFADHTNHLVHDPNNSLVAGDVVSLHRLRVSRTVHHVVAAITAPFGKPIDARPPVPTPDERLAVYKERRVAKMQRSDYELQRRRIRGQAALGNGHAREVSKLMELAKKQVTISDESGGALEKLREAAEKSREAVEKLETLGFHTKKELKGPSQQEANEKDGKFTITGNKGQRLPPGVLSGGVHEVGKIDERAKRNKEKAMRLQEKAEEREKEAEEAAADRA